MNEVHPSFTTEVASAAMDVAAMRQQTKRSLVLWIVRWAITAALYVWLWEHEWVRWTLVLTIPMGLFSLYMIHKMGYRLPRKYERVKRMAVEVDSLVIQDDNDRYDQT